ncbi:MAG: carbohydrate-binding family 9-like protein [bacterium]|nr:carbohydrate-binding family 9-like protein [candidate division KSB1 bacterium]MDH7559249.1 carbohydrate-binding family 9-like protein [bacterium]
MARVHFAFGMAALFLFCAGCLASAGETGYKQRLNQVLTWADTSKSESFFSAAAKIYNATHKEEGFRTFSRALRRLEKSPSGMFDIYSLMISYLAVRDRLPDSLNQQVRQAMRTACFYRGDTENHLTMYYTGLYLAAQAFPDLPAEKWYTGKSAADNMEEARAWLDYWMRTTTTIGQGEFDSPTYMAFFLAPMFGLSQWAEDPVMRDNAKGMLYWLIADFAVEHLEGMYVGAHSREYPERLIDKTNPASVMNSWAWLFFGRTPPRYDDTLLAAAFSDFVLPEVLYRIGIDRSRPYVHTETKRVRNIMRLGTEKNPPVYKYTYMTKDYALGSMMGGGILQPIQQHVWDVSFVTESRHASIFSVHPYIGQEDLGMFFPEEMKFALDEVTRFHTYYGSENKWSSSSPYEKTFQHKNALIVLYDIPPGTTFPHVDTYFPKDLARREVDPSGWIFGQGGRTYIAYFPLKPGEWIEESEGYRFRSYALKNGCIVEVAQQDEYPSFEEFKRTIRRNTLVRDTFDATVTVSYTTSAGDVMQFAYHGERRLNGTPINFADYGLFKGPFLNAEVGSRRLFIEHGGQGVVVDFAAAERALILPVVTCVRTPQAPALDGSLTDPVWDKAHPIVLSDAITGASPRYRTEVRLLYDESHLYVGFRCEDEHAWGSVSKRDGPIYEEECVEVFLNPASSTHQYYEVNLSPRNVVFDACIVNDRTPQRADATFKSLKEWDAEGLRTATAVDGKLNAPGKARAWTAEMAIPLSQLYGAPHRPVKSRETWRANFYRIDTPERKKAQELYAWSPTGRQACHLPWRFGYLRFE